MNLKYPNDMFETSVIYQANLDAAEDVVVNQGGTSSGKTYSIMQLLFTIAMMNSMLVITVVGQDVPNLKKGAYRDAKTIYRKSSDLQKWFYKPNESERIFTCINGSCIEFTSYQDEQDARSGKRDYLFVNEANGISYAIYQQLAIRTRKRIFIDYNPSSRFWVHEELIGKPGVKLIISDHRHNPFLSKEEHLKIESIDDLEFFKVYARGKTGKLQGLVYSSWNIVEDMPRSYKYRWIGLDFGFVNDPTAMTDVRLSGGELWIDELIYEKGMLNSDIAKEASLLGITRYIDIIADSAEPKSIAEIKAHGFKVEPALKGPDSIKSGIDILKRYKLNITRRSANIRDEIGKYRWKIDKDGKTTNTPVDMFNHALDSVRYVALNKLYVHRPSGRYKLTYK